MTVSTTHTENTHTGNGVQTSFSFTFRVIVASPDVTVYVDDVEVSVGDYSVSPNSNQDSAPGGSIIFDVAPANAADILIKRTTEKTQDADFPFEAKLNTVALETALDKAVMMIQENTSAIADLEAGGGGGGGINWLGAWSAATAYVIDDAVENDGSSYIATANNTNSEPPSANWDLLAAKGDTGSGGGGSGTVTSVALSVPSIMSVAGSPVTTSGTLAVSLATQAANTGFMGPATGADATPTFRSLVNLDIPTTLTGKTLGATTTFSAAPIASAIGSIDLGTDAAAFRSLYLSPNGGTSSQVLTSAALTADRTVTFPDANSNTVVPATASASNFATAISAAGVITFAQPASSDLSDASNVALRNNANNWSTAQLPSALGTIDLGSTTRAWRDVYIANGGSNYTILRSGTLTGNRTVTFPDADSNTVQPTTATSSQWITHITSAGVQTKAQPASSDLSDASNVALRNNANNWSTAQLPSALGTIDLGSTTRAWKDIYIANGGSNYTILRSGSLSGNRTVTFPDANSNTVQPSTAGSNQFATAISSAGVITWTQPSFSNISGTAGVSQGGTGNTGTPTNGQLLIGNGSGFTLASLTAGSGIAITPGAGSITIATTGGGGGGLVWTPRAKAGSFTASDGNGSYYRNSATGNITLPNSPEDGTILAFKQTSGTGTFLLDASDVIYMPFGTTETTGQTTIETWSGVVYMLAVAGGWEAK